jgi:hypothetical protein
VNMKLIGATLLLAVGTLFGAEIGIGIQIGAPPPPRVLRVRPHAPGPDYAWIDGYWYVVGHSWRWHDGYWTRPPYAGAVWVMPHHDGQRFYDGYWQGDRGRFEHDHRWDHDRDRDYRDHH